MKGKVIAIAAALILASGVFMLAGRGNVTSALSQKNANDTAKASETQVSNSNVPAPQKNAVEKKAIEPVQITEKSIKNSNEYIDVDIKIPVIGGLENTDIQSKINLRLENDALSFKEENEKNAKKDSEDFKKQGIEFRKYEAVSRYTVQFNKNGYLSLVVEYYMYTGGAHGMTDRAAYNYDLSTGEEIKLAELFKNEFNYKDYINKEILRQMKANEDIYFHGEGEFKTISDTQRFYITDGNIVVYFSQYEIAPYAAGFPEFKIPFAGIRENMKEKFLNMI